jgi:hypothetical protein
VFSDIGKGIGDIFKNIPRGPFSGIPFSPIVGNGTLSILPTQPFAPQPYYVSSGGGVTAKNLVMNSALPKYRPDSPTKGLGRIYEQNGIISFRKAPHLQFATRREARNYLKQYTGVSPMEGTQL